MKSKTARNRKAINRKQSGYALIAIMTVSAFALLLLFSLAGLSASLLQSEAFFKQKNLGLIGAEVGFDYARNQLTDSLYTGVPSVIEPADGETERMSDLPTDLVPQTGSNCKVRIRVRRLTPDNITTMTSASMLSPLIQDQWNPNFHTKNVDNWTNYAIQELSSGNFKKGDDWRSYSAPTKSYYWMVEVTSYRGIFATSLRGVLVPDFNEPVMATQKSASGFFPNTVVANSDAEDANGNRLPSVQVGDAAGTLPMMLSSSGDWIETGADNADFTGTVQSNGSINVSSLSTIIGNLMVTNPTTGAPDSVLSGQPSTVYGRIAANSAVDPIPNLRGTAGPFPDWANDNVYAMADLFVGAMDRQGANQTPINANAQQDSYAPMQVPSAESGSPLPAFPQDDGSGSMTSDVYLPPQSYTTSSFDSTGAVSRIIVNSSQYSPGTTKIFIDPNTTADSAVKIDTGMFVNEAQSSTSLQIYYAGNKPININLTGEGTFKGLIYAPNSVVTTSGTGDFNGAILANRLNINHLGSFTLDPDARKLVLNNGGSGGGAARLASGEMTPNRYRVASWQQVVGSLVPVSQ